LFAQFLASQPAAATRPPTPTGYEAHKLRAAARSRAKAANAREIAAGFCPCVNQARRDAAANSLEKFCLTYFPDRFNLPFSPDHRRVIATIERAIATGGQFALAMPRGSGKTELCTAAVLWAALRGAVMYSVLISASKEAAGEILDAIRLALAQNDTLADDWPEACYPIRRLEGIAQRRLLWHGQPIRMAITKDRISLPHLPPSPCAYATIAVCGITGRIRGRKLAHPDGRSIRPSLAILDDPQDDESANSPSQNDARERKIKGTVLGMAGPGKKIAAVCPTTVIAPNDLADRLLDRDRNPEWTGLRIPFVKAWPNHPDAEAHWQRYNELRVAAAKAERPPDEANAYYAANRATMDQGAQVYWPERYAEDEISAIQAAYNLRFKDPATWEAEYQQRPIRPEDQATDAPDPRTIRGHLNGLPRNSAPPSAQWLTIGVDVQQRAIYWTLAAWSPDFTGAILDYGTWPQQTRRHFTYSNLTKTLAKAYPGQTLEAALLAALTDLAANLQARNITRPDGDRLPFAKSLIDANWHESTAAVYRFATLPAGRAIAASPSHGAGYTSKNRPLADQPTKPNDLHGPGWRMPAKLPTREARHVIFDANQWKTDLAGRWKLPAGAPGGLTLYGTEASEHETFADHLAAEYPLTVTAKGGGTRRTVTEWSLRPNHDNHWLDSTILAMVAGSMAGARTVTQTTTTRRRRQIRYA
jgi:hypothetical protein